VLIDGDVRQDLGSPVRHGDREDGQTQDLRVLTFKARQGRGLDMVCWVSACESAQTAFVENLELLEYCACHWRWL
jgi:hypothetical protein